MVHVLLNPLANNGQWKRMFEGLAEIPDTKDAGYTDITGVEDVPGFLAELPPEDSVIIAGGDGTLSKFANDVYGQTIRQRLYFYSAGSGNDFLRDVELTVDMKNKLVPVNDFIQHLPTVTINGVTRRFINGIGFGIDGYCCEEGDKVRAKSNKPVNYTRIALRGLLFRGYHPVHAKISVDGITRSYKKVWLAPTMLGRYYGGGMKVAPWQNRENKEHTVTSVVMFGSGILKSLIVFPSLFTGEHVNRSEMIDIRTGHDVSVEFDRPTALQIDGETVSNVLSYSVHYD